MFSGFYVLFLLILLVLILRGVSFDWSERVNSPRGEAGVDVGEHAWLGPPRRCSGESRSPTCCTACRSTAARTSRVASGDLFSGYTVLAGVALVVLFAFHGTVFLSLRTTDGLRSRARQLAWPLGLAAAVVVMAFLIWTVVVAHDTNERGYTAPAIAAAIAVARHPRARSSRRGASAKAARSSHERSGSRRRSRHCSSSLFPRVMVSAPTFANSLTVDNASSAHYTLQVITIATAVLLPIILLYQAWTYRVFRARIEGKDPGSPLDALGPRASGEPPR